MYFGADFDSGRRGQRSITIRQWVLIGWRWINRRIDGSLIFLKGLQTEKVGYCMLLSDDRPTFLTFITGRTLMAYRGIHWFKPK